ncbi:hypothetical protein CUC00_12390 [Prevotella intermedia]|nr:hypothetical protein CTM44_11520 [Prevotella intermedia]ATV41858.1 hypothetical protein CUC00_12390 [Prevotella intermedia]
MQGKSGCFALQNSRFRNAKAQLLLFNGIIFTRLNRKSHCRIRRLDKNICEKYSYRTDAFGVSLHTVLMQAGSTLPNCRSTYLHNRLKLLCRN